MSWRARMPRFARRRMRVWRQCWYCDGYFKVPRFPGLFKNFGPYETWYCPHHRQAGEHRGGRGRR